MVNFNLGVGPLGSKPNTEAVRFGIISEAEYSATIAEANELVAEAVQEVYDAFDFTNGAIERPGEYLAESEAYGLIAECESEADVTDEMRHELIAESLGGSIKSLGQKAGNMIVMVYTAIRNVVVAVGSKLFGGPDALDKRSKKAGERLKYIDENKGKIKVNGIKKFKMNAMDIPVLGFAREVLADITKGKEATVLADWKDLLDVEKAGHADFATKLADHKSLLKAVEDKDFEEAFSKKFSTLASKHSHSVDKAKTVKDLFKVSENAKAEEAVISVAEINKAFTAVKIAYEGHLSGQALGGIKSGLENAVKNFNEIIKKAQEGLKGTKANIKEEVKKDKTMEVKGELEGTKMYSKVLNKISGLTVRTVDMCKVTIFDQSNQVFNNLKILEGIVKKYQEKANA